MIIKSKKGFILDTLTMAILLLLAIVIFFAGIYSISQISTSVQAEGNNSGLNTTIAGLAWSNTPGEMDKGFMIGFTGAVGFLVYSAYSIGTSPILFGIALILNIAILMIMPHIETVISSAFYNNSYATLNASLPGITFLINHYTLVFTGVAVLTMLALYVRPK